jgi:hypothetical protein
VGLTEKRRPEAPRSATNSDDLMAMAADCEQACTTRRGVVAWLPSILPERNFHHRIALCAPVAAKGGIVRPASGGRPSL